MKKSSLLLMACFITFVSLWLYNLFIPVIPSQGLIYYLKPGTSKSALITDLSQRDLIRFPVLFSLYVHLKPHTYLKAGEYYFPPGSSALSIWRQVIHGYGFFQRSFTIVPGWTVKQLRTALLEVEELEHELAKESDEQMMQRLGYPKLNPEGEFFPETYYYTRGLSDFGILKRAFDLMQKKLAWVWQQREKNLPFESAYQALIVASLIEKETHLDKERPIIAGVIMNRLKSNMLLQIDPTVIYGRNEFAGGDEKNVLKTETVLTKKNLLQNTPYNTYVHKGLPPTPIAIPSMASLLAAIHPTQHEFYYFVASGKEGHQFSKTLLAHQVAVNGVNRRGNGYFNTSLVKNIISRSIHFRIGSMTKN